MANIDFNKFEVFIEKCKQLQDFGYTFPTQLTNGQIEYNDIDYDSNGQLFIRIKTYTLFIVLSTNEFTHISLGVYYKEEDAIKYKQEFSQNTIYTEEQFDIKEGSKSIYESELDNLIDFEENKKDTEFNLDYNKIGSEVAIKIENPLYNENVGSDDENFEPEFLNIEEFEWVLIKYSDDGGGGTTVDIVQLGDIDFYIEDDYVVLLLNDLDTIYKVVVHRLIEDNYESKIKYLTFIT